MPTLTSKSLPTQRLTGQAYFAECPSQQAKTRSCFAVALQAPCLYAAALPTCNQCINWPVKSQELLTNIGRHHVALGHGDSAPTEFGPTTPNGGSTFDKAVLYWYYMILYYTRPISSQTPMKPWDPALVSLHPHAVHGASGWSKPGTWQYGGLTVAHRARRCNGSWTIEGEEQYYVIYCNINIPKISQDLTGPTGATKIMSVGIGTFLDFIVSKCSTTKLLHLLTNIWDHHCESLLQMRCQQCDPFKADATPLLSRNAGFPMHQAWLASGVRTYSTPCRCAKPELSLEASWLNKFEPCIATVETAGLLHQKSQHVGSDWEGSHQATQSQCQPGHARRGTNRSRWPFPAHWSNAHWF